MVVDAVPNYKEYIQLAIKKIREFCTYDREDFIFMTDKSRNFSAVVVVDVVDVWNSGCH